MTRPPCPPAVANRRLRTAAQALARHWGALAALALFLIAGLAILDDYGVTVDEPEQRQSAHANLDYLASGDLDGFLNALFSPHDKFYGATFDALSLLAERAFGVNAVRASYLSRHLIIHLFFLGGGLFAYLLARRLFPNTLLALLAMLVFLLHPRIYAHAFFNSKDIPFLAMFAVTLFLTHRAFKRDTLLAFALLGAGVGALTHLRIMGALLFAAVPALRALDFAAASEREERKRVLLAAGAFTLTGALTVYALLPYLWSDPAKRAVEWWTTLSAHPTVLTELFRGATYASAEVPAEYLPAWFAVTSPPFALSLGMIGAAAILVAGVKSRGAAVRNTRLRFGALLIGCLAAPILAVILLNSNVYNGWRQAYFLWAPFSIAAAFGLHWLLSSFGRARPRAAVYGAAGAGLTATLLSMVLIHPNQNVFFNALVDRTTPERLRTQYELDYWGHSIRQAWERVLAERPTSIVAANSADLSRLAKENANILPDEARKRASRAPTLDAFTFRLRPSEPSALVESPLTIYNNTLLAIERKSDLQALYARLANQEPARRSVFDVHVLNETAAYLKEPCEQADTQALFFLDAAPQRSSVAPNEPEQPELNRIRFAFHENGAVFDGKCLTFAPLPGYPIAAVRTGQLTADDSASWSVEFWLDAEPWRTAYRAARSGEPAARSRFDVYAADRALTYVKETCEQSEAQPPFFLHVFPVRADDLPEARRSIGFDNLDFDFFPNGTTFDGKCVASVPLPDYPVASVRTGQFVRGEGEIWSAEFDLNAPG